jgi:hypothetical protein
MALIPWSSHQAAAAARLTDEPATRAEIEEALGHAVHAARRTIQRVGDDVIPTRWDIAHRHINALLYRWQMAEE